MTTENYLKIRNADGKAWVLPSNNIKNALKLYQPSSLKGKILKFGLPLFYHVPAVSSLLIGLLKIDKVDYGITEEIGCLFEDIFDESIARLSLAFFLGTPSVHQKTTIQVSMGNEILGYCKRTSDEKIIKIFEHEKKVLDDLNEKGVENIPRCLFCGKIDSRTGLFIQSTAKSMRSRVSHDLSGKHIEFLKDLHGKTKTECSYEQTEYAHHLEKSYQMVMNSNVLNTTEKNSYFIAVDRVKEYYSEQNDFCAFHADFTPWNMFEEKGKLFVFDWEYSQNSFPPYIDLFHYFTQTEIFEKGKSADEIINDFKKEFSKPRYDALFKNTEWAYLSYLIYIIGFYAIRDTDCYPKDVKRNMNIWFKLIESLLGR